MTVRPLARQRQRRAVRATAAAPLGQSTAWTLPHNLSYRLHWKRPSTRCARVSLMRGLRLPVSAVMAARHAPSVASAHRPPASATVPAVCLPAHLVVEGGRDGVDIESSGRNLCGVRHGDRRGEGDTAGSTGSERAAAKSQREKENKSARLAFRQGEKGTCIDDFLPARYTADGAQT